MSRLDSMIQELCQDGVEYKTLDGLFVLKNGYTPSKKNDEYWRNGTVPWFRLEDIRTNGRVLSDAKQHVTSKAVKGSLFPANSIIVSTTATIGEHALIESPFLINQQLTCVSVKEQFKAQINIKFVFYYFEILKEDLKRIASQSGNMPIVSLAKMKQLLMPLPPLEVQEEIVRLLDDFTAKTAELQNKINEELEARKKQYECYKDMLLNNSENFINTTIGNISESVTVGIANSATQAYSETGVTMLRNQNIKENYLDDNDLIYINNDFSMKYKNKSLKENDILVTRTGYPGVACVVPKKYESAQTFTTLIVRLQDLKKTNPKYVCYYINSLSGKQYVRKMQSGAAQQNFGATALSKMPINIPDITTQNYIVKIFDNFDSTHSKISC